jgi:hypothetical protein
MFRFSIRDMLWLKTPNFCWSVKNEHRIVD